MRLVSVCSRRIISRSENSRLYDFSSVSHSEWRPLPDSHRDRQHKPVWALRLVLHIRYAGTPIYFGAYYTTSVTLISKLPIWGTVI